VYNCGLNLLWLNLFRSPCPGVPLSRRRVAELAAFLFPEGQPQFIGNLLTVGVHDADPDNIVHCRGSLLLVSPEELARCAVLACATDIRAQAGPETLTKWREILLSVPASFRVISKDSQIFITAYNLRQQLEHESMRRTALQTCHEILLFKQKAESEAGNVRRSVLGMGRGTGRRPGTPRRGTPGRASAHTGCQKLRVG
jgi:hypothetical protein